MNNVKSCFSDEELMKQSSVEVKELKRLRTEYEIDDDDEVLIIDFLSSRPELVASRDRDFFLSLHSYSMGRRHLSTKQKTILLGMFKTATIFTPLNKA